MKCQSLLLLVYFSPIVYYIIKKWVCYRTAIAQAGGSFLFYNFIMPFRHEKADNHKRLTALSPVQISADNEADRIYVPCTTLLALLKTVSWESLSSVIDACRSASLRFISILSVLRLLLCQTHYTPDYFIAFTISFS